MLLRFPAWKVALVLVTLLLGALACLPNLLNEQQREQYIAWGLPVKPLNLCSHLKGGASILLEVDPVELRQNELRNVNRAVGEKLRETPLIPVTSRNPEGDAVVVKLRNATDKAQALERIKSLGKPPPGSIGIQDDHLVTERADGAIEIVSQKAASKNCRLMRFPAPSRPFAGARTIRAWSSPTSRNRAIATG